DPGYHPLHHLVPAEPSLPRAAQDPQRIVLRRRDPVRPQRLGQAMIEYRPGAPETEERFLFETRKGPRLLDLFLESPDHVSKLCVATHNVKLDDSKAPTLHQ